MYKIPLGCGLERNPGSTGAANRQGLRTPSSTWRWTILENRGRHAERTPQAPPAQSWGGLGGRCVRVPVLFDNSDHVLGERPVPAATGPFLGMRVLARGDFPDFLIP